MPTANRQSGFTLIELMVVLAIVALLISIVTPQYAARITKAEETVLKEDLLVMRDALDKHLADAGQYPGSLEELVTKRYLRSIPSDPITQSNTTWIAVRPSDPQKGGVADVQSGARGVGSNGKPYVEW